MLDLGVKWCEWLLITCPTCPVVIRRETGEGRSSRTHILAEAS